MSRILSRGGGGRAWQGGRAWWGACVAGGPRVWQGGMGGVHGRGVRGRGDVHGREACVADTTRYGQ